MKKQDYTLGLSIIKKHYGLDNQDAFEIMHQDADAYHAGKTPKVFVSDYEKAYELIYAGCFACYHEEMATELEPLYGKRAHSWSCEDITNKYATLIARTYVCHLKKLRRKKYKITLNLPYEAYRTYKRLRKEYWSYEYRGFHETATDVFTEFMYNAETFWNK